MATERILVNSALESLVTGGGGERLYESARIVIDFGHKLSPQGILQMSHSDKQDSQGVSGCTDHGEFSFQDDEKEASEELFNIEKERVGKFRLWKPVNGILLFHRFWKSGDTTGIDELPDQYCLGYNDLLKPKFLGVYRCKRFVVNLCVFALEIEIAYLESIYGSTPLLPRIGLYILK